MKAIIAESSVTPGAATGEVPLKPRVSLNDCGSAVAALRILLVEDNAVNQRL